MKIPALLFFALTRRSTAQRGIVFPCGRRGTMELSTVLSPDSSRLCGYVLEITQSDRRDVPLRAAAHFFFENIEQAVAAYTQEPEDPSV